MFNLLAFGPLFIFSCFIDEVMPDVRGTTLSLTRKQRILTIKAAIRKGVAILRMLIPAVLIAVISLCLLRVTKT